MQKGHVRNQDLIGQTLRPFSTAGSSLTCKEIYTANISVINFLVFKQQVSASCSLVVLQGFITSPVPVSSRMCALAYLRCISKAGTYVKEMNDNEFLLNHSLLGATCVNRFVSFSENIKSFEIKDLVIDFNLWVKL